MRSIVSIETELSETIVTPSTDGFVCSQFVSVPHLTYETSGTTIESVDITVSICPTITSHGNIGIAFIKQPIR